MVFLRWILDHPGTTLALMLLGIVSLIALLRGAARTLTLLGMPIWRYLFPRPQGELICPICGYDIRYTPHRCPECGTKLMWGMLPSPRDLKRGNARWR